MDNTNEKAKADQAMAELCDMWPPMLFRFYAGLESEGFSCDQALRLTVEFMKVMFQSASNMDDQ